MKNPIDGADRTPIREGREPDDFPLVLSSKPRERYVVISCNIRGFSNDLTRALGVTEPQPQSRIDWLKAASWAGIAAVSALWMIGLIWIIQTMIHATTI
jgi:hypothetical protein